MEKILFCDCAYYNEKLYFISSQEGLVGQYDIGSNKISYCPIVIKEILYGKGTIENIQVYNGKIYALKTGGDGLLVYDIENNNYEFYNPDCGYKPWGNYICMTEYDSKLFIFTREKNNIKIFDCNKKEFSTIKYDVEEENFFSGVRVKDEVWLFPLSGSTIVKFDLESREVRKYITNIQLNDIMDCYSDLEDIYIVTKHGEVLVWNIAKKELQSIYKIKAEEQIKKIIVTKKNIILLPLAEADIIIIDKKDYEEEIYKGYPESFEYLADYWSRYAGSCKYGKKIYVAMRSANHLLIIDEDTGDIKWKRPELPYKGEKIQLLVDNGYWSFKEEHISLDVYIGGKKDNKCTGLKNVKECIGEHIWDKLKTF